MDWLSQSFRRQWLNLMLALFLGGLALNGSLGSSGARDLLILRHHSKVLTNERDRLLRQNADFQKRIARLKSDDVYMQRLIRQELGYVRPGEFVYRFPKDDHY